MTLYRRGRKSTFSSPADGTIVSEEVTIRASISDSDALATVEWLVDGESALITPVSGTSAGVSFIWRTTGTDTGPHTVTLVVTDATGHMTSGRLELITR